MSIWASSPGACAFAAIDAGAKHVTCIEFEEQFAERIRENFELYGGVGCYDLYVGDVHEQIKEFPNDHFDVVLCLGFFYHTSQHVTLAQEMCRVAKKTYYFGYTKFLKNTNFSGIELKTEGCDENRDRQKIWGEWRYSGGVAHKGSLDNDV